MLLILKGNKIYMINYVNLLKSIDLFKDFSIEEIDDLFMKGNNRIKEYKKNSIIYFQNEKCISFDVILKGIIIVQEIDQNGNVLTLSDFTVGDVIGGNLLFSNKSFYPMTVFIKSDATILHIEKDLILMLCKRNTNFLTSFLESISDKTLFLTSKIKSLSMKTIRNLISEFLIYESYVQNSNTIKLEMSKKELSEKFGIQRPSLSRELNKMRKDGLILFNSNSITILDLEKIKSGYK